MNSAIKIQKLGENGRVVIGLNGPDRDDPAAVFWSPQRWRDDGDRMNPAGGFNSFVLVEDPKGRWMQRRSEKRVSLLSINGIGEIRWSVEPGSEHYGEGAVQHFDLKKWEDPT